MRLASCCHPCTHAAGQSPDAGAAAGTATTSATAATTPTRVALMRDSVAPFLGLSDLGRRAADERREVSRVHDHRIAARVLELFHLVRGRVRQVGDRDRKSTRLNSSHMSISYAVFCLKKKK